jgi:hypothetical protein
MCVVSLEVASKDTVVASVRGAVKSFLDARPPAGKVVLVLMRVYQLFEGTVAAPSLSAAGTVSTGKILQALNDLCEMLGSDAGAIDAFMPDAAVATKVKGYGQAVCAVRSGDLSLLRPYAESALNEVLGADKAGSVVVSLTQMWQVFKIAKGTYEVLAGPLTTLWHGVVPTYPNEEHPLTKKELTDAFDAVCIVVRDEELIAGLPISMKRIANMAVSVCDEDFLALLPAPVRTKAESLVTTVQAVYGELSPAAGAILSLHQRVVVVADHASSADTSTAAMASEQVTMSEVSQLFTEVCVVDFDAVESSIAAAMATANIAGADGFTGALTEFVQAKEALCDGDVFALIPADSQVTFQLRSIYTETYAAYQALVPVVGSLLALHDRVQQRSSTSAHKSGESCDDSTGCVR